MADITDKQRQRIVEIYNGAIARARKHNASTPREITLADIPVSQIYMESGLIHLDAFSAIDPPRESDPIFAAFAQISLDRKNTSFECYHFKRIGRATDLLRNRCLTLNTLFSNRANDFAEFEELFRRYGPLQNLIPDDYHPPVPGSIGVIRCRKRKVDELKENIYVTCFTKSYDRDEFWSEYAQGEGACFRLEVSNFSSATIPRFAYLGRTVQHLYDFRDVCYDGSGYMFDYINEINYHLGQEFDAALFTLGIPIVARFYKRAYYSWEDEIRLCVDLQFVCERYKMNPMKYFDLQGDSKRTWISLPIGDASQNGLFDIRLTDIFCSKGLDSGELDGLRTDNFPNAKLWTYDQWKKEMPYKST